MKISAFFEKQLICILIIIGILPFGILANARNKRSHRQNNTTEEKIDLDRFFIDDSNIFINIFRKDLPLVRFKNPHITTRIYDEINKKKYLKNADDELYIAPTPDSMLIISPCTNGISSVSISYDHRYSKHSIHVNRSGRNVLIFNDKTHPFRLLYSEYIGHIKYNGHVIPIVTDEKYPIPWIELDSTEMANALIRLDGIPCKNGWSIIPVGGMLSEPEQIDSLTRNEMIHSWFDR